MADHDWYGCGERFATHEPDEPRTGVSQDNRKLAGRFLFGEYGTLGETEPNRQQNARARFDATITSPETMCQLLTLGIELQINPANPHRGFGCIPGNEFHIDRRLISNDLRI